MPRIIPIRDLKDTAAISQLCSECAEPVYITKNGYGDMVIMSMKTYEEKLKAAETAAADLAIAQAEAEYAESGTLYDAEEALDALRRKYFD